MTERLTTLKTVLWTLVGVLASVTVVRFAHGLGAVTHLSESIHILIGINLNDRIILSAGTDGTTSNISDSKVGRCGVRLSGVKRQSGSCHSC